MDSTIVDDSATSVMSRDSAKALGLKHYSTGQPCVNGHNAPKYVATNQCVECARETQEKRKAIAPRCSVDGCQNPVRARGMCANHNSRFVRHGDPLKTLINSPGTLLAWIDIHKDFSGDECLIWPFSRDSVTGYGHLVSTPTGNQRPHVIMCAAAHGEKPTPKSVAAHSCNNGSGGCLSPRHLRWASHKENAEDKKAHGTYTCGEKQYNASLTDAQVVEVLSMRGSMSQEKIGKLFGVSRGVIKGIFNGYTWKHIPRP